VTTTALLAAAALVSVATDGCAARYGSQVTIEPQDRAEPPARPGAGGFFPPDCNDVPLPEYPPELVAAELPPVRVRVDFTLDEEGRPRALAGEVLTPSEHDVAFIAAAESTVAAWKCSPAWRLPNDDEDVMMVRLEYRTWVVFRFEAGRVVRKSGLDDGSEAASD